MTQFLLSLLRVFACTALSFMLSAGVWLVR